MTESVALEADALHLKTDVITSAGVAIGLALMWITGWHILDPIIALGVALLIIYESWMLLKKAFSPLLDTAISPEEIEKSGSHPERDECKLPRPAYTGCRSSAICRVPPRGPCQ